MLESKSVNPKQDVAWSCAINYPTYKNALELHELLVSQHEDVDFNEYM